MRDDIPAVRDDELAAFFRVMPEDTGFLLGNFDDANFTVSGCRVFANELPAWNADQTKFRVVCLMARNIIQRFSDRIESQIFRPGTIENSKMEILHYMWHCQLWTVISVPLSYSLDCVRAADEVGCRFVPAQPTFVEFPEGAAAIFCARHDPATFLGKPLSSGTLYRFPLRGEHVMTLEPKYNTPAGRPQLAGIGIKGEPNPPLEPGRTLVDDILDQFQRRKK